MKSRIEFLINYSTLLPEIIIDKDIDYLKSINLFKTKLDELEDIQKQVTEIEESINDY